MTGDEILALCAREADDCIGFGGTLEAFFEKFDLIADAPDAVARMRELVLHLAVTGKLVPHDAEDKTATASFPRLASVAIEADDDKFPAHWLRVPLGKIGEWRGGGTPSKSHPDFWKGKIPWVSPKDMKVPHISDAHDHISAAAVEGSSVRMIPAGSLLMVVRGMILARAFPVALTTRDVTINQDMKALLPFESRTKEFLLVALRAFEPEILAAIEHSSHGTCKLQTGFLHGFTIPLPPLAEQKRIVAKVDELMALCDRLEAQQQERESRHAALARASLARFADAPTPANLHWIFHPSYAISPAELRKSILNLAVQGKLVPQDPDDEPAEVSFPKLASLAVESEDAFPAHWLRVPLGKTGEWRGGGTPSKSRPEFWKGDIPWVSPKDMKVLHIAGAQDHISPAAVEGSSVRLIPPGSLLMVVRGMILARAFPVALTTREVSINQDMKALTPSEPKTKEYLLVALRAFEPVVLAAIEHSSHGTCKLKTEYLHDFVMPIPPLAEQRRIVAKVEQLMTLVDALEQQLAAGRATAEKFLTALVAELTSSCVPGEPASRS